MKKIIKIIYFLLSLIVFAFISYCLYDSGNLSFLGLKPQKQNEQINSTAVEVTKYEEKKEDKNKKNFFERLFNKDENVKQEKEEPEFKIEKKDYSDYYNEFNVDDRIMLYDGEIKGESLISLYEVLIHDAEDDLFSKPNVRVGENFISNEDLNNYKNSLINLKNNVNTNDKYNVSFEYNTLKTHIETIVINKN